MSVFSVVTRSYRTAWAQKYLIIGVYLALRIVGYAVLAPVLAGLLNVAVSLSDQPALTDQDIARFVLTPVGAVAAVVMVSLFLFVEIFGFVWMTALWHVAGTGRLNRARLALGLVLGRLRPLSGFAFWLVVRVLAWALLFALVGYAAVRLWLSAYDINYYLTEKPAEFWAVGAVIALLAMGFLVVLMSAFSGWAQALHLVLFGNVPARRAFALGAERVVGQRARLLGALAVWLGVRALLMAGVGAILAVALNLVPLGAETGLRLVMFVTLVASGLWMLANAGVAAVALGALSRLVDDHVSVREAQTDRGSPDMAGGAGRGLLIAAGLAALVIGGFWGGARLLDQVAPRDDVDVIAHRGAAGARPENTLASVEQALVDGADWVEIDVQETADGQIVVMHDSDFMKLSGVPLNIWDATMEELADIDIGSWFSSDFADQRTPLLKDVLDLAKGRARVLIELKYYGHDERLEDRVVAIVEEAGMEGQIATMSLKYPAVQKMLGIRPDWRSGVLAATAVGNLAGLDGDFVAVNIGQVSGGLAGRMQAAGKELYVWTVNDPLEMSKMISLGVDGLITDEPALARQVIATRAGLNTAERLLLWLSEEIGLAVDTGEYRDASP